MAGREQLRAFCGLDGKVNPMGQSVPSPHGTELIKCLPPAKDSGKNSPDILLILPKSLLQLLLSRILKILQPLSPFILRTPERERPFHTCGPPQGTLSSCWLHTSSVLLRTKLRVTWFLTYSLWGHRQSLSFITFIYRKRTLQDDF